jgi:hypothetical protein
MAALKVTYGQRKDGTWWARVETETRYSVGYGRDAGEACLSAIQEAQTIIEEQ